jgi:hypothetical protein
MSDVATADRTYTVRTDADLYEDVIATSIDEAIDASTEFSDLASLTRHIQRHPGAWCWIDCDDVRVVELGDCDE